MDELEYRLRVISEIEELKEDIRVKKEEIESEKKARGEMDHYGYIKTEKVTKAINELKNTIDSLRMELMESKRNEELLLEEIKRIKDENYKLLKKNDKLQRTIDHM